MRKCGGKCFRKKKVWFMKMECKTVKWIVTGGLKREKYNLIMDTQ